MSGGDNDAFHDFGLRVSLIPDKVLPGQVGAEISKQLVGVLFLGVVVCALEDPLLFIDEPRLLRFLSRLGLLSRKQLSFAFLLLPALLDLLGTTSVNIFLEVYPTATKTVTVHVWLWLGSGQKS